MVNQDIAKESSRAFRKTRPVQKTAVFALSVSHSSSVIDLVPPGLQHSGLQLSIPHQPNHSYCYGEDPRDATILESDFRSRNAHGQEKSSGKKVPDRLSLHPDALRGRVDHTTATLENCEERNRTQSPQTYKHDDTKKVVLNILTPTSHGICEFSVRWSHMITTHDVSPLRVRH